MWAASRVFQETMGKRERLEDKNGKRTVVSEPVLRGYTNPDAGENVTALVFDNHRAKYGLDRLMMRMRMQY